MKARNWQRTLKQPRILALSGTVILLCTFQNCGGFGSGSPASGRILNLTAENPIRISPTAATVVTQGTLQFSAAAGDASSYRFSVIGTGTIDQISGLYTAPTTSNDDIVRVTDASGAAAFSFVKVAASASALALNPGALLIAFQSSFQFIATGGTPPFKYALNTSTLGAIDANSGMFTSANSAGSVTVTATDANGLTASSMITIQDGTPTLAPIYAPNPLSFGQVATFYLSDMAGTSLALQSGPGSVNGVTYSPGYQVGLANLLMATGNFQVPLQVLVGFVDGSQSCVHGKHVFNYTGADQTFTPPSNCPSLTIKLWGGGGSVVGYPDPNLIYTGGGGGFVSAMLAATETQNLPTLTIIVGGGGGSNSTGAYGGGGPPGFASAGIASGAGRSAIRVNGVEVLTAGGGGGGYYSGTDGAGCGQIYLGAGGAGGGLIGGNGSGPGANGTGGTQVAGGTGASGNGSQFQGGGIFSAAGGGGGGYYGGAGGGASGLYCGDGVDTSGGGGGGSSYIGGGGQTIYEALTIQGSGYMPGNMTDPDYVSPIGLGGGATSSTAGGNGMVVITW